MQEKAGIIEWQHAYLSQSVPKGPLSNPMNIFHTSYQVKVMPFGKN